LSTTARNGEYSKVNVIAGNVYSFQSSKTSDFITISDGSGTISYATGTATVNWTASFSGQARFYTHKNSACDSDTKKKTRKVSCTLPPCYPPGPAIASAITDNSATITWTAATVNPLNGYQYEVRTSGAGGSGASGLITSGTTIASVISVAVSALTPGTLYNIYVRSDCNGSFSSYIAGNFTTTGIAPNPVPAFSHIVVVIGENTNVTSVFGSASAPYINALAATGAKFTNSFALFHPSQPNYIALYSGSNQGVTNDNYITTKYTTANLGASLIAAGKTYKTYSEGLPSVGYDGASSGLYARKHNPAANWMGTGTNQIPNTPNQPFTAFPADFNNLPNVAFVIPDLCNDGHDVCSPLNNRTLQYDNWIETRLDAYKQWAVNNNSLLIVTYDEDDFTSTNKIATVFYGAYVAQATYAQTINHYNVLRTIEEANRLTVHAGAAGSATPITYCWNAAPVNNLFVNPTIPSGKEELLIDKSIIIYPNPAVDKIKIVPDEKIATTVIANWEISDNMGIVFKRGKGDFSKRIEIPVNELKNGLYIFRYFDGAKMVTKQFKVLR
jgi:acid phosphatase